MVEPEDANSMIEYRSVVEAASRIAGTVVRTPTIYSDAISRRVGADVWLKLATLQATGAFKERGASNRLATLSAEERARGVVAMSAGSHAQAVARHASLPGIRATIVLPAFTPATKVTRTSALGCRGDPAWADPDGGCGLRPRIGGPR
jgi:threonine dehydratase